MNVLIAYVIIAGIALIVMLIENKPKIGFIERLKQREAMKYVEYIPVTERYLEGMRERYIVLHGIIRKDGVMHTGYFVYDRHLKKYVHPDFTVAHKKSAAAHTLCDNLNEEQTLYNEEIETFTNS